VRTLISTLRELFRSGCRLPHFRSTITSTTTTANTAATATSVQIIRVQLLIDPFQPWRLSSTKIGVCRSEAQTSRTYRRVDNGRWRGRPEVLLGMVLS
jgi:hypothetical protein